MGHKIEIPKEMLMHIDFNNTILGGGSEPRIVQRREENAYEVAVKTPGIAVEDLQIEIAGGRMSLYHLIPIFSQETTGEEQWKSIRFISNIQIPSDVDQDQISARYDEAERQVIMSLPFSHPQDGIRRKVDIERW